MNKNKSIFYASRNAFDGIKELLKEKSSRVEIVVIVAACILWLVDTNSTTQMMFVLSIILLAVESLNTAIEKISDLYTLEIHPEIKKIKDLGAAAILLIVLLIAIMLIAYLVGKVHH